MRGGGGEGETERFNFVPKYKRNNKIFLKPEIAKKDLLKISSTK